MKLLGGLLSSILSANSHLSYVTEIDNQLNQLHRQGLDINVLAKVFSSLVVTSFLYALPAFQELSPMALTESIIRGTLES